MKKLIFTIFLVSSMVLPVVSQAQVAAAPVGCSAPIENISAVLNLFGCIIRSALIPLLITLCVIVFIIGIIKYIAGADEATKREEGRNFMIYGIVALFVVVSVWGLVGIIQGTFGLGNGIYIPQMQGI